MKLLSRKEILLEKLQKAKSELDLVINQIENNQDYLFNIKDVKKGKKDALIRSRATPELVKLVGSDKLYIGYTIGRVATNFFFVKNENRIEVDFNDYIPLIFVPELGETYFYESEIVGRSIKNEKDFEYELRFINSQWKTMTEKLKIRFASIDSNRLI